MSQQTGHGITWKHTFKISATTIFACKENSHPLPLAKEKEHGDKGALTVSLKMRDSENTAGFFLKII